MKVRVLSKYSDLNFREYPNAVVRVGADELGGLLRESEDPAHTEFVAGDIDPYKCECAKELITFIIHAHKALSSSLANQDTDDDVTIFRDLLPSGRRVATGVPGGRPPFDVEFNVASRSIDLSAASEYDAAPGSAWRFMVVYDSLILGTTSRSLVKFIRQAGAKEVHFRIGSPPIRFPCFYGIDMPSHE